MAIKKHLKINNSWPELFNFQNSFNCTFLVGRYWDFNSLLKDKILHQLKLKAFADDKIKGTDKLKFV